MSYVYTLGAVDIPGDLEWIDEFSWSPVAQHTELTLGGSILLEESAQIAGRHITLRSGQDGSRYWGVVTLTTLTALQALANAARSTPLALVLPDARSFNVYFRHGELAIDARPLRHRWPADPSDLYLLTIRLQSAE